MYYIGNVCCETVRSKVNKIQKVNISDSHFLDRPTLMSHEEEVNSKNLGQGELLPSLYIRCPSSVVNFSFKDLLL